MIGKLEYCGGQFIDAETGALVSPRTVVETYNAMLEAITAAPRNNMAVMRYALLYCKEATLDLLPKVLPDVDMECELKGIIAKCVSALAEPARNCDRFQVAAEALREWQSLVKAAPNTWDFRYNYWLFAPTAERKGEGDGR